MRWTYVVIVSEQRVSVIYFAPPPSPYRRKRKETVQPKALSKEEREQVSEVLYAMNTLISLPFRSIIVCCSTVFNLPVFYQHHAPPTT